MKPLIGMLMTLSMLGTPAFALGTRAHHAPKGHAVHKKAPALHKAHAKRASKRITKPTATVVPGA